MSQEIKAKLCRAMVTLGIVILLPTGYLAWAGFRAGHLAGAPHDAGRFPYPDRILVRPLVEWRTGDYRFAGRYHYELARRQLWAAALAGGVVAGGLIATGQWGRRRLQRPPRPARPHR
jgi:hypothetical protein